MARKARVEFPGAVYHVLDRGDRREPIFRDDSDRRRFLATLGEACARMTRPGGALTHIGCAKVNIDTDLRLAMKGAVRKALVEGPKEFDLRKYLAPGRVKVKELVRHKVRNVLCCAGHAFD
jgi:fructose-bisphosphate aldolase class II